MEGDRVYTYDFDGQLYASDAADGRSVWQIPPAPNKQWTGIAGTSDVLVATEAVVPAPNVGTTDMIGGEVVALDPAAGKVLWRAPVPLSNGPSVAIAGSWVIAPGINNGVFGIDAATGAIKWHTTAVSASGHPTVMGDVVVLHGNRFDGVNMDPVLALELGTGRAASCSASNGSVPHRVYA